VYIALAPDAVELQHEGEGRVVLLGALLVRKRETRVHQAQIETGLRGLGDRIRVFLQHGTTVALGAVVGKSKMRRCRRASSRRGAQGGEALPHLTRIFRNAARGPQPKGWP